MKNEYDIKQKLATELSINLKQIDAFITLFDDGNTIPFIARYRKEQTDNLDDTQLRTLETRLLYLRELVVRKTAISKSLTDQNKLTAQLTHLINDCESKSELELIYQPFKSKRVSKSDLAIQAGFAPLADKCWFQGDKAFNAPQNRQLIAQFINNAFPNRESVIDGINAILVERITEEVRLVELLRKQLAQQGMLTSKMVKGQEREIKYKDYFDYQERFMRVAPHRLLAMLRGKKEGVLRVKLKTEKVSIDPFENSIARHLGFALSSYAVDSIRREVITAAWKKLKTQCETQLITQAKETAYENAIDLFAANLKELLMAAPAGRKVVLGLDPGFKSGCKIAVVDATGNVVDYATIYPHQPVNKSDQAAQTVQCLIKKYNVELIAIGNGTASRESEQFISTLLTTEQADQISTLIVSESGASVYSASQLAADEFPDLDVSIRGTVSIARRLQDPLAELVKIDPKAIGVGLYQHDVNQTALFNRLQAVVEDCVNAVGVDLNSASVSLLTCVAGLNDTISKNIVKQRDEKGVFTSRASLNKVPRLGAKAFQQAAGFLRVQESNNPLDNSAVHPESYELVKAMAKSQAMTVQQLLNDKEQLLDLAKDQALPIKWKSLINELLQPSRDPRPEFKTIKYAKGVNKIADLEVTMTLQGVVTNVTSFGAFVDIGVHQDGLVHISQLADKFVCDPMQIVKAGQIVEVRVLEVDADRKRISLSMKTAPVKTDSV
ncbi:MAG TPA: RNA-binding transcriptional accessory protein [Psychromonas hadalis]|nr:RNA-binding transcriptional accessory protein [Psychromonas hadalis]